MHVNGKIIEYNSNISAVNSNSTVIPSPSGVILNFENHHATLFKRTGNEDNMELKKNGDSSR